MIFICQAYRKSYNQEGLEPCPHKALRSITFKDHTDCTSGNFCARHAIALRRKEARGAIEILTDEPMPNREIDTKSYYGL